MAALTVQRSTIEKRTAYGATHELPSTAAVTYFKGGMVARDASTGLVLKAAVGVAADTVCGIASQNKVTIAGDNIRYADGIFLIDQDGSLDQTDVGKLCYVVDDQTVTEDSATGTPQVAGSVYQFVSASQVYVQIVNTPAPVVALDPTP